MMNPRTSLRYILGVYEHELNDWITRAIPQVDALFDVGANHGYFSFGVMAAWRRLGRRGSACAFEPQLQECALMLKALKLNESKSVRLSVENCFVSDKEGEKAVTLDEFISRHGLDPGKARALVKIDVEGAEMRVLHGAKSLVRTGNLFLVEVHSADLLKQTQAFFLGRGHSVEVVAQRRLPILGGEARAKENWWVVTRLPHQHA